MTCSRGSPSGDVPIDTTGDILTPALRSAVDLDNYMQYRYNEVRR